MIRDEEFLTFAAMHNMDATYNTGSKYFNSKATRIAYFKFKGDYSDIISNY